MVSASKHNVIVRLDGGRSWPFVILNPLVGNADFLNEEHDRLLADLGGPGPPPVADARMENLARRGYICDDAESEGHRVEDALEKTAAAYRDSKHCIYAIVPTMTCPLACPECPSPQTAGSYLDTRQLDRVIQTIQLIDSREGGTEPPQVVLYGGECLPDNEPGFQIAQALLETHLDKLSLVTFYTSGFDTERYAALFRRDNISKVAFVFTITAIDRPEGRHSLLSPRVEEALDFVRRRGCMVLMNVKVTAATADLVPDFVNYMMERGIAFSRNCLFRFAPLRAETCPVFDACRVDYTLYDALFQLYAENPQVEFATFAGRGVIDRLQHVLRSRERFAPRSLFCEAFSNLFVFHPDGGIYPCYSALCNRDCAIGNWTADEPLYAERLAYWRNRTVTGIPACRQCPAQFLCSGGCGYDALVRRGSLYEPACQPVEEMVRSAFERMYDDFQDSERYVSVCGAPV